MAHIAEAIQQGLTSAWRSDCEGVLTTLLITSCQTNRNRPLPAPILDALRCPSAYGERNEQALQQAGGEPDRGRRRKTPEPKHRSEQKAAVLVRAPDNVRHLAGDSTSANSAAS